ncbi:MAG: DUF3810 family protein [Lachnospiraceae bacterium]|nr:DUF3810 family protein [Lachnospiraceae bacterium]
MERKSRHWYWKILAIAGIIILAFVPIAYVSGFATWYADHVYPRIQAVLGRATGWFPFALGEVLMYVVAVYVAVTVIILIVFGILALVRRCKRGKAAKAEPKQSESVDAENEEEPASVAQAAPANLEAPAVQAAPAAPEAPAKRRSRFLPIYMKVFLACVVIGLWLYVFNWWIPYHDYVLSAKTHKKEFTFEEIFYAHNELAKQINAACLAIERDADGKIIYPGRDEAWKTVVRAMQSVSGEYVRLKGYYPMPKVAMCSDVLEWMNIGGYTYPYTLELTYNKYINNLYFYNLLAHEAAHHKGYYKENEAMFLSFYACRASDDPLMVMGGLWDVYWRVYDALSAANEDLDKQGFRASEEQNAYFNSHYVEILPQVYDDFYGAREEAQEAYEEDDHPLEEYRETAEQAADVGWDTQAELIGEFSYDGVLQLVLEYYAGQMTDEDYFLGGK